MNRRLTQAPSVLVALLLLAGPVGLWSQTPTADEILKSARLSPASRQEALRAELNEESGRKTPFTIGVDHGTVSYSFTNPEQQIQLVLGSDSPELRVRQGGQSTPVKPARFDEKVRGTAVTYEDLSLRFLYWPNPKLLGDEMLVLRRAWKIEVMAPRGQSQYAAARLWIDQESGAALQIEGYGRDGLILKRFKVISPQTINGKWMLKTMRIETFDPTTHKVADRTQLKVLGPVDQSR